MFAGEGARGEATAQERRDPRQPDARMLGRVIQCDGAMAVIASYADAAEGAPTNLWNIGKLISVSTGQTRLVGMVCSIEMPSGVWAEDEPNPIKVHLELIGEVRDEEGTRRPIFDRGITVYPNIGAIAHQIRARDLEAVYQLAGRKSVVIGSLSQNSNIDARISVDSMLNRHFAIVGTTGVGKSTAVSLLLHKAIEERPDLRILILDPHNEFAAAFRDQAARIDQQTLDLPFWLFRLEELTEVLFRGRENVAEEVDILRDLIPIAKVSYRNPGGQLRLRRASDMGSITADTPLPYRMSDVLRQIDERMGSLDAKLERPALKSLKSRIESIVHDASYRFMFGTHMVEDTIHQSIGRIFRVPHEGRPIMCFQLAGMPSEVVNSVCSVLARLAFDLAQSSQGKLKLLVVCEEAHRYMPSDPRLGFAPTRHALARIAKEGRKYGCYLGVVTQRPGELDPTILSQCSSVFAMRLANDRDQEIIRTAIADSSASTLAFLSSMGQREAIAFGEAVATPMRLKFEELSADKIPGAHVDSSLGSVVSPEEVDLQAIIDRMRRIERQPAAEAEEDQSFFGEGSPLLKRPVAEAARDLTAPPETSGTVPGAYAPVHGGAPAFGMAPATAEPRRMRRFGDGPFRSGE
ncbi:ATP-binding protein [Aquibium sp. ELW1220]|jgi:DNA helicase HerA-like ATPase|uniref:ATP-binding protein n=1 Tax=Aquibium sp. ELW1220 TaxID=2976766 RepID=UPI0025AF5CCD|nr:ATP-binding protein [Aquibium sp. ELW1220]MDN2579079.1 ATP-binding protein [Aquibium sp. ELW1220]